MLRSTRKSVTPSVASALLALAVAGCVSGPEGVFEPACIAHAGERIVLGQDLGKRRFEWDRFSDAVSVDAQGNRVDPFPDYPKTGSFAADDDKLTWTSDDGTALDTRYLLNHRGRTWLLSYEENEAVLDGEAMPSCALVLQDEAL